MAGAQRWLKDHERRPELLLLGCTVIAPSAVAVVLLGLYRDWPDVVPALAALAIAGATATGAAAAWENGPRRSAALGSATVAVVLSALLVTGAAVLTQRPVTAWLRFGLVVVATVAALVLASADWSRRWLLRLSAVFVVAAVVLLVQIGQADLASSRERPVLQTAPGSDPESRTTSYVEAAGRGPTALLESVTGSDRADRLTPGPVGWLALGAVALLGWGTLLRRNARQLAGPVLVEKLDEPEGYDADLRIAVLENVAEPDAVPGASVITPVTELLSLSPAAGRFSKAVQTVFTVIGQSYGYRVEAVVDEPNGKPDHAAAGNATPPAATTRVLVRVKDLRSSTTLAGHVESAPDTGTAVRAAGLWAAGFILGESSREPSWAAWTSETARSLAAGREGRPGLDVLKEAVRGSPNSGVLLVQLGQAHEMKGEQIDAVSCHARAVAAHPTYLLARYRLAAAVAMLGTTIAELWPTLGPQRRDEVVDSLRRACRTLPPKAGKRAEAELDDLRIEPTVDGRGCRSCYRFAREFLQEVEYQTGAFGLLTTSLRREDRDDRMPLLWSTGPTGDRQRVHWLARSARLSCSAVVETDAAKRRSALRQLRDKADQPGTWWQVGYNAACAHCLAGQPGTAITLLEECLLHPGSHQLDGRWLTVDPDLESIQQSPRFRRLVERVAEGDRRA